MKKIKQKAKGTAGVRKEFTATQFFYSQKSKIAWFLSLSVIIILCVTLTWLWFRNREVEANFLFSQAKDTIDYEEIVSGFSFTKTKPLAMVAWARELFNQKKYDEAITVYKKFIKQYPKHNLAPSAYIGLAYCYEEKEDTKEAEALYVKVREEFPNTVWAKEAEEEYKRVSSI